MSTITITRDERGTTTILVDLAAILAMDTERNPAEILTTSASAPVEIPTVPAVPAKPAGRKPRKPAAVKSVPAASAATDEPTKRDSAANKAAFREISALKRAKRWDEATALAASLGWDGEVASIARKRAAVAAA